MKYFHFLNESQLQDIFYIKPEDISLQTSPKNILANSLGATLYIPSNRENISTDILKNYSLGLNSFVLCLEDSVPEEQVFSSINNLFSTFAILSDSQQLEYIKPMIFIRVRNLSIFRYLIDNIDKLNLISGFVFPKFTRDNAFEYLELLKIANQSNNKIFYGMPILESKEIIYKESRFDSLSEIRKLLVLYKNHILNVRIGATDFLGIFSIRRTPSQTVYDISVLRDVIGDIVNIFLRPEDDFVVSGPVWEYFIANSNNKYNEEKYLNGLIAESLLDKANGLVGKTIIHPSHIKIINALQAVSREEYEDAKTISERNGSGVFKSYNQCAMNEVTPQKNWANKILIRSKIYGVLNNGKNYTDLL